MASEGGQTALVDNEEFLSLSGGGSAWHVVRHPSAAADARAAGVRTRLPLIVSFSPKSWSASSTLKI
jgi:hypothetical protein